MGSLGSRLADWYSKSGGKRCDAQQLRTDDGVELGYEEHEVFSELRDTQRGGQDRPDILLRTRQVVVIHDTIHIEFDKVSKKPKVKDIIRKISKFETDE